ncbi:MAG TPA: hypothetical protein DCG57_00970 [Candidatus Riflebacteria bacterium]|nr:hypothetical protein [Candidatus Riflebacteria bacterium]
MFSYFESVRVKKSSSHRIPDSLQIEYLCLEHSSPQLMDKKNLPATLPKRFNLKPNHYDKKRNIFFIVT